jgi:hypothetical protein
MKCVFQKNKECGVNYMKTWEKQAFSPWAFAAIMSILICGFVFIGCKDGGEEAGVNVVKFPDNL